MTRLATVVTMQRAFAPSGGSLQLLLVVMQHLADAQHARSTAAFGWRRSSFGYLREARCLWTVSGDAVGFVVVPREPSFKREAP